MRFEVEHLFLAPEKNWLAASHQVQRFFERSILVRYDSVEPRPENSLPGTDNRFLPLLEKGLARNRVVLADLLDELEQENLSSIKDLLTLEQGYKSKLLHTVSHLLDGFFGIDSYFFNLAEDSHQISDNLRNTIAAEPDGFWLIEVLGFSEIAKDDPFSHLRTFEKPSED